MKHDQIWFESRLAREFAKLKPQTPKPVLVQTTVPVIETCGDAVYLQFLHLNLILIIDQKFYANTLTNLLQSLAAVLVVKDGRVFVLYTRSGIEYPLERLVVARVEDYWSVRLKRETQTSNNQTLANYRASNIVVEKTSDRAHQQWLTEEEKRNHGKPYRMFQIDGKRIDQIFDANHISDSLAKTESDQAKPTQPKGYGPGQDETEDGGNLWTGTFVRGDSKLDKEGNDTGEEKPLLSPEE